MLEILDLNIDFYETYDYDTSDVEFDYIDKLKKTKYNYPSKYQIRLNKIKLIIIYFFYKLYKF